MKLAMVLNLVLLSSLGLAGGTAKLLRVPAEVDFFQTVAGLGDSSLLLLGLAQLAGGVFSALPKTRIPGLVLLGTTLVFSVFILVANNKVHMGIISVLPVLMTIAAIAYAKARAKPPYRNR